MHFLSIQNQHDDSLKHNQPSVEENQIEAHKVEENQIEAHKVTHVNKPVPMESQPPRIQCDQCSYIGEDVTTFVKHIRAMHTVEHCQYCDYRAKDRADIQSHLIKDHEEIVLLHSMAQQVNDISDRFELFETFKEELGDVIKSIAATQNAVKQELFLIRNKQAELSSANLGSAKPPAHSDIPVENPPQACASVSSPGPKSSSSPLPSSSSPVIQSSDTTIGGI